MIIQLRFDYLATWEPRLRSSKVIKMLLGLGLSISLSLVFFKKMVTSEIEFDEDLMD